MVTGLLVTPNMRAKMITSTAKIEELSERLAEEIKGSGFVQAKRNGKDSIIVIDHDENHCQPINSNGTCLYIIHVEGSDN